eukprot:scaffold2758_cov101-Isochrysis_galbana.AAC.2
MSSAQDPEIGRPHKNGKKVAHIRSGNRSPTQDPDIGRPLTTTRSRYGSATQDHTPGNRSRDAGHDPEIDRAPDHKLRI